MTVTETHHPASCQAATFSYFQLQPCHEHEKPYEILINLPEEAKDVPRSNLAFEAVECSVEDTRGRELDFDLDRNGFMWKHFPTSVEDLKDRSSVEDHYLKETENFLRGLLGPEVRKVKVFNWKVRVSQDREEFSKRTVDLEDELDPLVPVQYPHVDQSPGGAAKRANFHLPEEVDELMKGRFRIINVWRPLSTVRAWPLAVCDARSVDKSDMVLNDLVRRSYIGESYFIRQNPEHKWYYLSNQTRDEVSLLKIYDSDEQVDAKFCVHSSFEVAGQTDERESIEVRAMVFSYPKGDTAS